LNLNREFRIAKKKHARLGFEYQTPEGENI
jgi:hypothetical protein